MRWDRLYRFDERPVAVTDAAIHEAIRGLAPLASDTCVAVCRPPGGVLKRPLTPGRRYHDGTSWRDPSSRPRAILSTFLTNHRPSTYRCLLYSQDGRLELAAAAFSGGTATALSRGTCVWGEQEHAWEGGGPAAHGQRVGPEFSGAPTAGSLPCADLGVLVAPGQVLPPPSPAPIPPPARRGGV